MHTQLQKILSHSVPPARATFLDEASDAALLELLGDLSKTHAVVLGEGALEFMCTLLRRGCIAATVMRRNEKMEAETAELVIVPHVACLEVVERALGQARRAMLPNGRVVLRIEDDRTGWIAFSAARLLRMQGFLSIRVRRLADQTLLTVYRARFSGHKIAVKRRPS